MEMETYEVKGAFSGNVKIYHYKSWKQSNKVILVLKGIYGEHIPDASSWDNTLVKLLQDDYNIIFVRTSRLSGKIDRDAFIGKTFEQECSEVEDAFDYCNKNIFSGDYVWGCVGASLGGTTLLGLPKILSKMSLVIMAGSGCGKNPNTTRPLTSTLPSVDELLQSLDYYHSVFTFLHGENDTVVPLDSQQMIYERASKSSLKHEWVELPNLDHRLRDSVTGESYMAGIIKRYILENFT